jgi:branched-chain amino acid transport system substrate-binding protein
MSGIKMLSRVIAIAISALVATGTAAQTVKIGVVNTLSGPQASFGEMTDRAMKLYYKLHEKELPQGVKLEFITRDDGGPNPDKARQLAQELVIRDKVQILAGAAFTPVGIAVAQIATEAKVPFVITNAATSVVTTRSPYAVRFSFTQWQTCYPLGKWAATKYKNVYLLMSDYAPSNDFEEAFSRSFKEGGGVIVGSVRVPVQIQDFAPYLQRVKDTKPEALVVFVPAGKSATALVKGFGDLGLRTAGIKLIGTGDITPDEELPNMGDEALGVTTVFHYSAAAERPANKAFVAAWKNEYGAESTPNFVAAASWDATDAIFQAVKAQNGKIDTDRTMELLKAYKNPNSPRGPISIDPETRDIVQNEYLREIRKVNGRLANVEVETVATAVKDPWKELQRK